MRCIDIFLTNQVSAYLDHLQSYIILANFIVYESLPIYVFHVFQDHIQEVIDKWDSIDDEIWAKVIVLERNRRVAKAYARAPVITVNGSTDGFDGFRIGVAGFDNPLRDSNTSAAIQALGLGLKLKMDDVGNVLVKRISRYVIPSLLGNYFLDYFAKVLRYF